MGIPGYAYLVEAGSDGDTWQKVGVAADHRRVDQHRGWRPLVATVQVPGYRLGDPRKDVEAPVLESVRSRSDQRPTEANPRCPDCGSEMPDLPAHGYTEAWHVPCRGSRLDLFNERIEWARANNPYPDWSLAHFTDGELEAHSLVSSNGRLAHVAEFPQTPNRTPGSNRAEHTAHVATSFYIKLIAANEVLDALSEAAMEESNLLRFIVKRFEGYACRQNGEPMRKPSGSGGISTIKEVQYRLNRMAREKSLTVGFINDRTQGMLHAFADPAGL